MRSDYLRFGGVPSADAVRTSETLGFLRSAGFGDGSLTQARRALQEPHHLVDEAEAPGGRYCDFCLSKLMGGEYDALGDGRERCVNCSRTAVRTQAEFVELFKKTRRTMEVVFEISIRAPMEVQMVDAKEMASRAGVTFEAAPGVAARVLGFASSGNGGYKVFVENGAPAMAAVVTIVHELTHVWQFANWEAGMVATRYGADHQLIVTEGMATWAQIQYLLSTKELEHAERHERVANSREDEYGVGFRLFCEHFPLRKAGVIGRQTPFSRGFPL